MNKFINQPTQADIQDIYDYFTQNAEYFIALGKEDFDQILKDSQDAVVVECLEYGEGRLWRAFDAAAQTCTSLALGKDIYSSNRFLIQVSYSDNEPLLIEETNAITDFVSKLPTGSDVIWSIAKENLSLPYTMSLKVIAASFI